MNQMLRFFAAATIGFVAAFQANAAVVYDNGGPNTDNGFSIANSNTVADDFTLSSATTITSVTFYFQNYNGIAGWNQDITYKFMDAAVGGSVLATGTGQNLTAVDSGLPWCCGGNAWKIDFDLETNFAAQANTQYWLALTGATGGGAAWWVTTDYLNGSSINGNPVNNSVDFAFALSDNGIPTPVPLPAGAPFFLTGFVGLAWMRRRKSNKPE